MQNILRKVYISASLALLFGGGLSTAVAADDGGAQRFIPQGPEAGAELFPPNPQPGGCYARVLVPAQYKTETSQMVKSQASERLEIIPAEFETREETLIVKEASERLEIVPATYETVEEQILVKPAFERLETIPAEYETVSEQVIDKPAHVVWKKGRGMVEKVDFATGEILCLKEIPASHKTVTKRVVKSPATTRTIEVPAEYKTIKKRIVKNPPTTKMITIPEETKVQSIQKLVEPAKVQRTAIPEEQQTITKSIRVSEEKMAWEPILCETNTTPQIIRTVQKSLKENGYKPGAIDGDLGDSTMKAVVAFQKEEGLSRGGLTPETLKALKVDLPWAPEVSMINGESGSLE